MSPMSTICKVTLFTAAPPTSSPPSVAPPSSPHPHRATRRSKARSRFGHAVAPPRRATRRPPAGAEPPTAGKIQSQAYHRAGKIQSRAAARRQDPEQFTPSRPSSLGNTVLLSYIYLFMFKFANSDLICCLFYANSDLICYLFSYIYMQIEENDDMGE